jgi:TfoX/Sxy family transcriptional regulator of competence genes
MEAVMAYDQGLAQRIREELKDTPSLTEKEMFGGISFLINGNMACGVIKDDLIVRVDPANHEELLARSHARPFDFTGRPMKGWVTVSPEGYESDADLKDWINRGLAFAQSLPAK